MAIYPGAVYKPTPYGGRTLRNKQGRGILHVAVSGARSLPPWNSNTWHFYVAADGYCEQYVDTEYRAYAAADANDDAIMVETAGGLGASAVLNAEEWTPAQAARLADLMRWEAQQVGGAPLALLPDSKPGRRGWGPHRLGIQHSRGIDAVPGWLVSGGERWSSAIGKECPGDAKVRQIPQIIAAAAGGASQEDEELDMSARDDIVGRQDTRIIPGLQRIEASSGAILGILGPQILGKLEALTALVTQLADKQGTPVDMDAIDEAVRSGVADAIAGIDTTVTVKPAS